MGIWPVSIGSESSGLSLKSQSPVAGDTRSVSNRAVLGLLKALDRGLCERVCVCKTNESVEEGLAGRERAGRPFRV